MPTAPSRIEFDFGPDCHELQCTVCEFFYFHSLESKLAAPLPYVCGRCRTHPGEECSMHVNPGIATARLGEWIFHCVRCNPCSPEVCGAGSA